MRKFRKVIIAALIFTVVAVALAACNPKPETMTVTAPTKTVYYVGDAASTFDLSGGSITVQYSDNKEKSFNLTEEGVEVTGFNTSVVNAALPITVKYLGLTDTFNIEVKAQPAKTATSIAVTKPTKLIYFVGDTTLDLTGSSLKVTYSDGSTGEDVALNAQGVEVTGFNTSVATAALPITVKYLELTDTFNVEVKTVVATIVTLSTAPAKNIYFIGEAINLTGGVLSVVYNNGDTDTVDVTDLPAAAIAYDFAAAGKNKTVTITYLGFTATYAVNVFDGILKLEVKTPPTKTVYNIGDTLNLTGCVITIFYDEDIKEDVTLPDARIDVAGFGSETYGNKTLVFSYKGETAEYVISIGEPDMLLLREIVDSLPTVDWNNIAMTEQQIDDAILAMSLYSGLTAADKALFVSDLNKIIQASFAARYLQLLTVVEDFEALMPLFDGEEYTFDDVTGAVNGNTLVNVTCNSLKVTYADYLTMTLGAKTLEGHIAGLLSRVNSHDDLLGYLQLIFNLYDGIDVMPEFCDDISLYYLDIERAFSVLTSAYDSGNEDLDRALAAIQGWRPLYSYILLEGLIFNGSNVNENSDIDELFTILMPQLLIDVQEAMLYAIAGFNKHNTLSGTNLDLLMTYHNLMKYVDDIYENGYAGVIKIYEEYLFDGFNFIIEGKKVPAPLADFEEFLRDKNDKLLQAMLDYFELESFSDELLNFLDFFYDGIFQWWLEGFDSTRVYTAGNPEFDAFIMSVLPAQFQLYYLDQGIYFAFFEEAYFMYMYDEYAMYYTESVHQSKSDMYNAFNELHFSWFVLMNSYLSNGDTTSFMSAIEDHMSYYNKLNTEEQAFFNLHFGFERNYFMNLYTMAKNPTAAIQNIITLREHGYVEFLTLADKSFFIITYYEFINAIDELLATGTEAEQAFLKAFPVSGMPMTGWYNDYTAAYESYLNLFNSESAGFKNMFLQYIDVRLRHEYNDYGTGESFEEDVEALIASFRLLSEHDKALFINNFADGYLYILLYDYYEYEGFTNAELDLFTEFSEAMVLYYRNILGSSDALLYFIDVMRSVTEQYNSLASKTRFDSYVGTEYAICLAEYSQFVNMPQELSDLVNLIMIAYQYYKDEVGSINFIRLTIAYKDVQAAVTEFLASNPSSDALYYYETFLFFGSETIKDRYNNLTAKNALLPTSTDAVEFYDMFLTMFNKYGTASSRTTETFNTDFVNLFAKFYTLTDDDQFAMFRIITTRLRTYMISFSDNCVEGTQLGTSLTMNTYNALDYYYQYRSNNLAATKTRYINYINNVTALYLHELNPADIAAFENFSTRLGNFYEFVCGKIAAGEGMESFNIWYIKNAIITAVDAGVLVSEKFSNWDYTKFFIAYYEIQKLIAKLTPAETAMLDTVILDYHYIYYDEPMGGAASLNVWIEDDLYYGIFCDAFFWEIELFEDEYFMAYLEMYADFAYYYLNQSTAFKNLPFAKYNEFITAYYSMTIYCQDMMSWYVFSGNKMYGQFYILFETYYEPKFDTEPEALAFYYLLWGATEHLSGTAGYYRSLDEYGEEDFDADWLLFFLLRQHAFEVHYSALPAESKAKFDNLLGDLITYLNSEHDKFVEIYTRFVKAENPDVYVVPLASWYKPLIGQWEYSDETGRYILDFTEFGNIYLYGYNNEGLLICYGGITADDAQLAKNYTAATKILVFQFYFDDVGAVFTFDLTNVADGTITINKAPHETFVNIVGKTFTLTVLTEPDELEPFYGTWYYTDGGDEFTVVINSSGIEIDVSVGDLEYTDCTVLSVDGNKLVVEIFCPNLYNPEYEEDGYNEIAFYLYNGKLYILYDDSTGILDNAVFTENRAESEVTTGDNNRIPDALLNTVFTATVGGKTITITLAEASNRSNCTVDYGDGTVITGINSCRLVGDRFRLSKSGLRLVIYYDGTNFIVLYDNKGKIPAETAFTMNAAAFAAAPIHAFADIEMDINGSDIILTNINTAADYYGKQDAYLNAIL